jgi:N-acetylmuramoyl-L-alanine amidase
MAHEWGAVVLVSIHVNHTGNPDTRGFVTLYQEGKGKSKELAQSISNSQTIVPLFGDGIINRDSGHQQGTVGIINRFKNAASVLVEVGFISNEADRELMVSKAHEIGKDIAIGVVRFMGIEVKK